MVPAVFVDRPNRFIVRAETRDGERVDAHLADPGRLKELLVPGAALRLRPASDSSTRRTRYTVALVRASTASRAWVSVDTSLANGLAAGLLERGVVRGLPRGLRVRAEVRHGGSRFDFRLEQPGHTPWWIEVKSVTLVERGVGLFPDAPTARGRKHVSELAGIVREGGNAAVLFVVQRGDARSVRPHAGIDPAFAETLASARGAGVLLRAARFEWQADGRVAHTGPLRVYV